MGFLPIFGATMHHLLHLVFELAGFAVGCACFQRLRSGQGDPIDEPKRVWIIIGAAAPVLCALTVGGIGIGTSWGGASLAVLYCGPANFH